jgi:hypothetical protein
MYLVDDDVADHINAHAHLRCHLATEVVAAGGVLLQYRAVPASVPSYHTLSISAFEVVPMIFPGRPPIYGWPPTVGFAFTNRVTEAPGLQVLDMVEEAPGQWQLRQVTAPDPRQYPQERFQSPHPEPGILPPLFTLPTGATFGDVVGVPDGQWLQFTPISGGGGSPLDATPAMHGQIVVRGPAIPPPDPTIAMLMRAQADAVRRAQSRATAA